MLESGKTLLRRFSGWRTQRAADQSHNLLHIANNLEAAAAASKQGNKNRVEELRKGALKRIGR